jgi:protein-S-isoprenylcysteine O-methyltransferase Ste14
MTSLFERAARLIAIVILAFELPVPVYWLILHGPISFWRRHMRAAFPVAVIVAWGIVDSLLYWFRLEAFRRDVHFWAIALGLVLIAFDIFALAKTEFTLGGRRIVGHSELAGSRELIARGLYTRVRHPRYLGMMSGVLGAWFIVGKPIVGTGFLWLAAMFWLLLVFLMIRAEERELRARLGPPYAAYAEHVPALLPFPRPSRAKHASAGHEHRP